MQATLLATSHYLQPIVGDALPSLTDALADVCRTRFRRIDRFVQLALLGSARCARGQQLDRACGIYMASALGPVGSNVRVQRAMLREHEWPKPFDFIHTLGGSAGFYVASNLGLDGPSWCLGVEHGLFAAMTMALTDLAAGVADQALVGVVEEMALPQSAHRARLGVAEDVVLAEGSHWWLLQRGAGSGRELALHRHGGAERLAAWLDANGDSTACVGMQRGLEAATAHALRLVCPQAQTMDDGSLPFHASMEAAWFAAQSQSDGSLALLVGERELLHLGA